jgi:hypothetical protein
MEMFVSYLLLLLNEPICVLTTYIAIIFMYLRYFKVFTCFLVVCDHLLLERVFIR